MIKQCIAALICLALAGCAAGVVPVAVKVKEQQPKPPCKCTVEKVEIKLPEAIPARPDEPPPQWVPAPAPWEK